MASLSFTDFVNTDAFQNIPDPERKKKILARAYPDQIVKPQPVTAPPPLPWEMFSQTESYQGLRPEEQREIELKHFGKYGELEVRREAAKQGVDPDLMAGLFMQESGGDPAAVSQMGAQGLMQLMPAAAEDMGVDRMIPSQNVQGGVGYFRQQLDDFSGDEDLALAAYYAGPGKVRQALREGGEDGWTDWLNANTTTPYGQPDPTDYIAQVRGRAGKNTAFELDPTPEPEPELTPVPPPIEAELEAQTGEIDPASYLAAVLPQQQQEAETGQYGAGEQMLRRQMGNIYSGLNTFAAGMIDIAPYVIESTGAPISTDALNEWADFHREQAASTMPDDPQFIDKAVAGLATSVGFLLPGVAIARGARAMAGASELLATAFGVSAASVQEGLMEAGDVYDTLVKGGMDAEQAQKKAHGVAVKNVVTLAATNALGGMFNPAKRGIIQRAIQETPFSALEEGLQEVYQLQAHDESIKDNLHQIAEATAIGGMIGPVMGGSLGAYDTMSRDVTPVPQPGEAENFWQSLRGEGQEFQFGDEGLDAALADVTTEAERTQLSALPQEEAAVEAAILLRSGEEQRAGQGELVNPQSDLNQMTWVGRHETVQSLSDVLQDENQLQEAARQRLGEGATDEAVRQEMFNLRNQLEGMIQSYQYGPNPDTEGGTGEIADQPDVARGTSLAQWVAMKGGIRPLAEMGEQDTQRRLGLHRFPGLLNNQSEGSVEDMMRSAIQEGGFQLNEDDIDGFVEMLGQDVQAAIDKDPMQRVWDDPEWAVQQAQREQDQLFEDEETAAMMEALAPYETLEDAYDALKSGTAENEEALYEAINWGGRHAHQLANQGKRQLRSEYVDPSTLPEQPALEAAPVQPEEVAEPVEPTEPELALTQPEQVEPIAAEPETIRPEGETIRPTDEREGITPETVHQAVDQSLGEKQWDTETNPAFGQFSQSIVGTPHIDEMTSEQRDALIQAVEGGAYQRWQEAGEPETFDAGQVAEVPQPTPNERVETTVAGQTDTVDILPTERQKEAGNYKHGHVRLKGLDISIENPKGTVRSGRAPDGTEWSVVMPAAYGYARKTIGADGDQIDVYLGDNPASDKIFVVDQVDADSQRFDEHKAFIGFDSLEQVAQTYDAAFDDGRGPERRKDIAELTTEEFKEWVNKDDTTKPVVEAKAVEVTPEVQPDEDVAFDPAAMEAEEIAAVPPVEQQEEAITPPPEPQSIRSEWNKLVKEGQQVVDESNGELLEQSQQVLDDVAREINSKPSSQHPSIIEQGQQRLSDIRKALPPHGLTILAGQKETGSYLVEDEQGRRVAVQREGDDFTMEFEDPSLLQSDEQTGLLSLPIEKGRVMRAIDEYESLPLETEQESLTALPEPQSIVEEVTAPPQQEEVQLATPPSRTEGLNQQDAVAIDRGLNRIAAEMRRVQTDPSAQHLQRLEKAWNDMQAMSAFGNWLDTNEQAAFALEEQIEDVLGGDVTDVPTDLVSDMEQEALGKDVMDEIDEQAARGEEISLTDIEEAEAQEAEAIRYAMQFVPYAEEQTAERASKIAQEQIERSQLEAEKEDPASRWQAIKKEAKQHLGTEEERLQAIYGDKEKGREIWEESQRYQIKKGLREAEIDAEVTRHFTDKAVWEKIKKKPWVGGERGTAFWTKKARENMGKFSSRFGVAGTEKALVFRAAEAALRVNTDGTIEWGTKDPVRDEEGNPVLDENGNPEMQDRYTPEEGRALWNQLSDQGKEAVTWWVGFRDQLKTEFEVISDVQGYMHHHFPDDGAGFNAFQGVLGKKKAGVRKQRKGAEGYLEDPEAAIIKGWTSLENERLWNTHVEKLMDMMTEPLNDKAPLKDGWVAIPMGEYTRLNRFLPKMGGGRQIPAAVYDDFLRFAELEQDVSATAQIMLSTGRFFKTNMLIHPGSAVTNTLGGAMQYATMVTEDMFRVLTKTTASIAKGKKESDLNQAWKKLVEGITAPIRALDPKVMYSIPPELFGAKSNVATQFGPARNWVDRFNAVALWHYGAIENYWKRAIALAELRSRGINPTKQDIMENEQVVAELSRVVDTFAFNYENQPRWMTRMKQNPVGAMVLPFPTYPYKLGHLYARYVRSLNPFSWKYTEGGRTEGAARMLTMMSIMGLAMGLAYDEEKDKVGAWADGMPHSLDKSGRLHLRGWDTPEGKERWLRTVKYPWLNLVTGVNGGGKILSSIWKDAGFNEGGRELGAFLGDMVGEGPVVAAFALLTGYADEFSQYKTFGTKAGELAGSFIPLSRMTQDIKMGAGWTEQQVKENPQSFLQAFLRAAPVPQDWTGVGKISKDKTSRNPNDLVLTNPTLDQLKFWFGITIKEIDPRVYSLERMKNLVNATKLAAEADNVASFDRAIDRIKTLDPKRYGQIKERLSKKRILISERQIRRMRFMEEKARRREALNTPTPVPAPAG